ncbi:hypothetical protein DAI22_06g021600 [Oryza sativa Japonica Group]|nr:hypothetical protein DAI22_06g021600 [Oryza sativa Japonica Group]
MQGPRHRRTPPAMLMLRPSSATAYHRRLLLHCSSLSCSSPRPSPRTTTTSTPRVTASSSALRLPPLRPSSTTSPTPTASSVPGRRKRRTGGDEVDGEDGEVVGAAK